MPNYTSTEPAEDLAHSIYRLMELAVEGKHADDPNVDRAKEHFAHQIDRLVRAIGEAARFREG